MSMSTGLKLVGGLGLAAGLAYCVYFDYKRTHAPDYQEKIRKRREEQNAKKQSTIDPNQLQAIFNKCIEQGQALVATQPQLAARHFANAVRISQNPSNLIQILKRQLPPQVFLMIMQDLQANATE
ncbi:uncharacterized protein MONBRDRAFT_33472 [Monosiga brevicollis MX1]|uniref:Uncharacterized protein n=1 Tax=Monosiga brevicollis TaxID=81824 RepID=A9V5K2_MONBE|nr:uncharacterized protein MONBRDRAFT_33472 [Monosiga brevicollis MX1]EDQ87054.1 predicted protein [Monosiga brevicollis MX1]|eukprot:XP_001747997.1 hypothetical protein [Monosiga brevicollis MX1]